MSNKMNVRVAMVKFTVQGTSYPTRCPRKDIGVGDEVEVLMWPDTPKAAYFTAEVTDIEYSRYAPRGLVLGFAREAKLFDLDNLPEPKPRPVNNVVPIQRARRTQTIETAGTQQQG